MTAGPKSSFIATDEEGIVLWTGNPDCDAGHGSVLAWLRECGHTFLVEADLSDNRLKGNLGEAVTFHVGHDYMFADPAYHADAANATTPFSRISKPGVDIVWLHFGQRPADDLALLQEVKTTGDAALGIADRLIDDYNKLFGTDPQMTLQTRLMAVKNRIEYEDRRPELAKRISFLAGKSPQTSPRIRLLPTVVHERADCEPRTKMLAIRAILTGKGWSSSAVTCWSIALTDLDARITRLATGRS